MKKLIVGLAVAALLPLSASLQAKTVCLSFFNGLAQVKMTIKPIKKPGTYSPIVGIYQEMGNVAPIEGSAMVDTDGTIVLGFQGHFMASRGYELLWSAVGLNANFEGTYYFDSDGDGDDDDSTSVTAISCKDFTL